MPSKVFILPIKVADNTPISVQDWAKETLSESDYEKFQAAQARQDAIFQPLIEEGQLTVARTPIVIGGIDTVETTITTNGSIDDDAEWLAFYNQFTSDESLRFE
jgi:hypothetical protein